MIQFKCECCGKEFELDKAVVIPNPAGDPIYICETCDGTTNKGKRFTMCSKCLAVKDATKGVFIHDNEYSCEVFTCDECILKSCPHVSQEQLDNMKKDIPPSENTCVCCGEVIPEGRQVCWSCGEKAWDSARTRSYGESEGIMENPRTGEEYRSFYVDDIDFSSINKLLSIHKIIDDAMEKRDRMVSIFISAAGTSVNVSPYEDEKAYWIETDNGMVCSNCGNRESTWDHPTYCSKCGELMHGIKKKEK